MGDAEGVKGRRYTEVEKDEDSNYITFLTEQGDDVTFDRETFLGWFERSSGNGIQIDANILDELCDILPKAREILTSSDSGIIVTRRSQSLIGRITAKAKEILK